MQNDPNQDGGRDGGDWTLQFAIEAERSQEYIKLYESLGNEVRVEAVDPSLKQDDECATCLMAACDRYVVIYTQPKNAEAQA